MIGRRAEQMIILILALARFVFCCYRAVHQSIIIDEAFTYVRFVKGPWSKLSSSYDANNHVLHTILARLSIQAFGLSEFTFRLPSLIAGFFLILGVFWVLQSTTSPLIRWVTITAVSLEPLLLDFSIAARGYGMGIAFLIWAVYFCMRKRYFLTGILLGLGVSANLTIAFPALGLMFAVFVLEEGSWFTRVKILCTILAPTETLFLLICYAPLHTATMENFYIGFNTMREWLFELVNLSLHAVHRSGLFGSYNAARLIQTYLLPLAAILIVGISVHDYLRRTGDRFRFLPVLSLTTTIAGLVAAHLLFGIKYPLERTALYVVPLFCLAWAIAADAISNRTLRAIPTLAMALLAVQFTTQLHGRYFELWRFDMDTKAIATRLKDLSSGKPNQSVTLGTRWLHQPALEFYRDDLSIAALKPVEWHEDTPLSDFDYYVLQDPLPADLQSSGLAVLFSGAESGVVFAKRP